MLSREENELITRVGPGTPGGELLRRYWQPAALVEQLLPGGAPVPLTLFGEELVLFRDEQGRPGLLGLHCAHRGADLSYGRLEDGGLRCLYHGWLYNVEGRCLEQPGEPAGSTFHERIRQPSYPCLERAGVIFAYMGPGEPPLLPAYEFLTVPEEHVFASKLFAENNYFQGVEGGIDPTHVAILHRELTGTTESMSKVLRGAAAEIQTEETDFGVRIYMIRPAEGERQAVGITNYILPNINTFAVRSASGYSANWFVPVDDTHHWKYTFIFDRDHPLDKVEARARRTPTVGDYQPVASKANRYLQDREAMKDRWYTGISPRYFQAQDACINEGSGTIADRSVEHLAYTDRAVIASRDLLLQAVREVQAGREPPHVVRDPTANRFEHMVARQDVLPASADWRSYWKADAPVPAAASARG